MGHVCVAGGGEQAAAVGEVARGSVLLDLREQQPALLLRQPGLQTQSVVSPPCTQRGKDLKKVLILFHL